MTEWLCPSGRVSYYPAASSAMPSESMHWICITRVRPLRLRKALSVSVSTLARVPSSRPQCACPFPHPRAAQVPHISSALLLAAPRLQRLLWSSERVRVRALRRGGADIRPTMRMKQRALHRARRFRRRAGEHGSKCGAVATRARHWRAALARPRSYSVPPRTGSIWSHIPVRVAPATRLQADEQPPCHSNRNQCSPALLAGFSRPRSTGEHHQLRERERSWAVMMSPVFGAQQEGLGASGSGSNAAGVERATGRL